METSRGRILLLLITTFGIIHIVQSQDQPGGFISLDCGLPANETSPYKDTDTGLWLSSDENIIKSGKSGRTRDNPEGFSKSDTTLRYFPEGIRNCYNVSVEKNRTYLIRASFVYGNYDGLDNSPVFDLHLGPNPWAVIDLQQVNGSSTQEEILHVPTSNSLEICLVKNGTTTPLISTLELRPMKTESYKTTSGSLKLFFRRYYTKSGPNLRYMEDLYDRTWAPFFAKEWTEISTALKVDNSNDNRYDPPEAALANAATPTNTSLPLTVEWSSENTDEQYYYYAHIAELQELKANETREFSIVWEGGVEFTPFIPLRLSATTAFAQSPLTCKGGNCSFQLIRTNKSTLPPLLSALEVYTVIQFPQSETDEHDVGAIKDVAATYALSRVNWKGDPCVPQRLRWDGLDCRNTIMSTPPRITVLNLSSSGLNGIIATAIQSLTQLEKLDLSNNNLTGEVPEFLGNMKSLLLINLTGNNLGGSIPQSLRREGLELLIEGNRRLCVSGSCRKTNKTNPLVPVVATVSSVAVVIAVAVLLFVLKKRKSTILEGLHLLPRTSAANATFANKRSKRFTYSEVLKMTNNFQRVLGQGGFGMVYHGTVDGSEQVAVKVLSQSSKQGYKEFKAEVELLMRVHHTHLVSLVGYCDEGDHLALIYEFMPNGELKQHLSGRGGRSIMNWSIRLRIALEAALGLEYLHIGCTPSMVHRDVKTANILLDENFKAKIADFGLSRSFQAGGGPQDSTAIAGTPGYLDPEYNRCGRLDEKSDVYSFGIVLLEMLTNQPVINRFAEYPHITQWVGFKLNQGDIGEIMDPNFRNDYDSNSAWRALEVAMSCANPSSSKRPSMSQVINELKECIVCEHSRMGNSSNQGLASQEMSISEDTSMAPMPR